MAATPDLIGVGSTILWNIPAEISSRSDITHIKVWRSPESECGGYVWHDTIGATGASGYITSYTDTDTVGGYWLVTFTAGDPGAPSPTPAPVTFESNYNTTYRYPSPRELRIIEAVRRSMPDVITKSGVGLNDSDYMVGLNLAIGIFNSYPPQTYFNICNFPASHEYFLVGIASLTTLASRFLTISIRDWSYSEPGGVVMNVDRGAKINQALQIIGNVYSQYLPLVKLDFASDFPTGVGTVQLPLSMGGVVSRGLLNILDIYTATGR
jgi:hypothetical protein